MVKILLDVIVKIIVQNITHAVSGVHRMGNMTDSVDLLEVARVVKSFRRISEHFRKNHDCLSTDKFIEICIEEGLCNKDVTKE